MKSNRNRRIQLCIVAIALIATLPLRDAGAYVEAPHSLGKIVASSTLIVLVRVKEIDREKNTIIYTTVRSIRGTFEGEIKHQIGQRGFHAREWKNIMAWARVGKPALFFTNGGHGEMCIDNYWYQAGYKGWSAMTHAEPYFLRAYAGRPEKLATYVTAMLAGQEVVVPCMVDGDKMAIQERTAKIQRMRASLKLGDYNPKRDFVGWGAEDFRPISSMPGFTHSSDIGTFSPGASNAAPADYNGDGKTDVCIFGNYRVALLKNDGGILSEEAIPVTSGARAAAWGDYDSDGKPDLLIASSSGVKLLGNNIKLFVDQTPHLPLDAYNNPRAIAWIDYDGDKKLDILVADKFRGLRLYRNMIPRDQTATAPAGGSTKKKFVDVSDAAGLGETGIGANLKGQHLTPADVNGDGRTDVLYSAAGGMILLINTPKGFVIAKDCGLSHAPGQGVPVFGDYNRDGKPDLLVPQKGVSKLFRNDGAGRFTDVTAASGDLSKSIGWAKSAAWVDFDRDGRLDLFVGCLKGPNRYFQGQADGTFKDASEAIGLMYRIYNTSGLTIADINTDDMPDLVLNNEGQASIVLLGAASWGMKAPVNKPPAPAAEPAIAPVTASAAPAVINIALDDNDAPYGLVATIIAGVAILVCGVGMGVLRRVRSRLPASGPEANNTQHKSEGAV